MMHRDLTARRLSLPETDGPTIAVITGPSIRHQWFAHRIRQTFGDLVTAWYQISEAPPPADSFEYAPTRSKSDSDQMAQPFRFYTSAVRRVWRYGRIHGFLKTVHKILTACYAASSSLLCNFQQRLDVCERWEEQLFAEDIEKLCRRRPVEPDKHHRLTSKECIDSLKQLSPDLLLSVEGFADDPVLGAYCRGIALNLHPGWMPTYQGTHAIFWALYHRRIDAVGSTIHLIPTNISNAVSIVRRSYPCLVADDTPVTCFLRSFAAGVELMIEVVNDILTDKELEVYDFKTSQAETFRTQPLNASIRQAIYHDFTRSWPGCELERLRQF